MRPARPRASVDQEEPADALGTSDWVSRSHRLSTTGNEDVQPPVGHELPAAAPIERPTTGDCQGVTSRGRGAQFTPRVNRRSILRCNRRIAYGTCRPASTGETVAEPNHLLHALIEDAGLSHAGLASRINNAASHLGLRYDHASVARWIRDGAVPRHPAPDLICEILGARLGRTLLPADLGFAGGRGASSLTLTRVVEQAKALWRADHRAHSTKDANVPLTGSDAVAPLFEWENPPPDLDVSGAGRRAIGPSDVALVLAARSHYEQMYRSVGGVPVRPRLVAQLSTQIAPMLDGRYDDAAGRSLFRAVGGLVAFAGICAYDAEQKGQALAQRYLFHALRMAKASGDKAFGAYVVALLTNQAIYLGDFRLAIQYAETALRAGQGTLSPALRTDLHAMQAKSYARIGDVAGCHGQMRLAETAAAQIDAANEPAETSYVQPGLVAVQHSEALRRVGDFAAAREYAEQAVGAAPSTHSRGQVHRLATLSLVLTARKEIDESVGVARQAFTAARGMESWRIRDRLATVAERLSPYSGESDVKDFLGYARTTLAMTAT